MFDVTLKGMGHDSLAEAAAGIPSFSGCSTQEGNARDVGCKERVLFLEKEMLLSGACHGTEHGRFGVASLE